jgi:hypothetical protein
MCFLVDGVLFECHPVRLFEEPEAFWEILAVAKSAARTREYSTLSHQRREPASTKRWVPVSR